ncbi:DUF4328 domain-containing protein [Streptomyces sp. P1-3]|uniref:DUF4328 domain-containing protein n=1 Tax=Streptomyces sp. P1-3 TaxID=3421658 RepID=UPI003D367B9C
MYPCGNCRAAAVGPDGRCAACGTYQQQLSQAPAAPTPYPAAPAMGMPAGGVDLRRGLATTLTVLFGVVIFTLILVLVARGGQYSVLGDILDHKAVTQDEADDADGFYAAMYVLNGMVTLPIIIVWVIWFHRLRRNAEVFAPGQHRMSTGWAAGSWFTPVVNLWFPKQIANDIWRASSPQGPQGVRRGLLTAWWATFMTAAGVGFVGNVMYTVADNKMQDYEDDAERGKFPSPSDVEGVVEDARNGVAISILGLVIVIAAAILAIMVVRQITAMQEQRAALPPQGGPAPYGAPNPYGAASPYGQPGAAPYGQPGAAPYGQPGPAPYGQPGPGQSYPPHGSGPAGY